MAAHRYWRIYATTSWTGTSQFMIGSVVMRGVSAGANLSVTGNGTASASTIFSATYNADKVFLGDETAPISAYWLSLSGVTLPQWLKWDFGAGNGQWISELVLWCGSASTNQYVKDFQLQYSDDDAAWITAMSGATSGYTASTATTFVVPYPIECDAALSIPSLSLALTTGVSASAALPALTASIGSGASAAAVLSGLTANVAGHDSTGERALNATLPPLSVSANAGGNARSTLPKLSASASGTVTTLADADISLPSLSSDSDATVSGVANAVISLPSFSTASFAGAVCSITVGKLATQATGTTGSIGRAQVTLPLFEATSAATAENYGSANITLPSLAMGSTSRAALMLPGLDLTAIGTATITATYEAYAINLNHKPRGNTDPVDETTRYTNFPFTHVVRYRNSYYGANSTGLYLLEGTTDDATPIPWAVKTAMTDFDSPTHKTVASAYFGGRLGPADTITLHAGEGAQTQAYSYTTPRGALAQNYRQVFGKGIRKHRYYALAASGSGAFELDDIDLDVVNLSRRI